MKCASYYIKLILIVNSLMVMSRLFSNKVLVELGFEKTLSTCFQNFGGPWQSGAWALLCPVPVHYGLSSIFFSVCTLKLLTLSLNKLHTYK